jgi:hypothetical protein
LIVSLLLKAPPVSPYQLSYKVAAPILRAAQVQTQAAKYRRCPWHFPCSADPAQSPLRAFSTRRPSAAASEFKKMIGSGKLK